MRCANPECGDYSIVSVYGEHGLEHRCNTCGAVPRPEVPQAPRPVPQAQASRIANAPRAARPTRPTPTNVLALARAEARELKREIRALEAKKRQLAALERLLSAAQKKPSDGASNVRPLRKQGTL